MRRCWRFGQVRPVECYVVTAETEGAIVRNIERKEQQAAEMMDEIVNHMAGLSLGRAERSEMAYEEADASGRDWRLLLGDAVERIHRPRLSGNPDSMSTQLRLIGRAKRAQSFVSKIAGSCLRGAAFMRRQAQHEDRVWCLRGTSS